MSAPAPVRRGGSLSNMKERLNELDVNVPIYFDPKRKPRSPYCGRIYNGQYQLLLADSALKMCCNLDDPTARQVMVGGLLLRTLPPLQKAEYWTEDSRTMYLRILLSLFKNAEYGCNFKDHAQFNGDDLGSFLARTIHNAVDPWWNHEHAVKAADTDEGMVAEHKLVVCSILRMLMQDDPEVNEEAFGYMTSLGIMARDDENIENWEWPACFSNAPAPHSVPYYRIPIAETDHSPGAQSKPLYQVRRLLRP